MVGAPTPTLKSAAEEKFAVGTEPVYGNWTNGPPLPLTCALATTDAHAQKMKKNKVIVT